MSCARAACFTYLRHSYTLKQMCGLKRKYRTGIQFRKYINDLRKELFRKSIHVCALFVPVGLNYFYLPTLYSLAFVLVLYVLAELLRINGKPVLFISSITAAAARKRDENKFVLGPVTLACGVLLTAVFFDSRAATIGISALALGDGIASLAGKMFGQIVIPFTNGKSAEGSLACFLAVFLSSVFITGSAFSSFFLAFAAMIIEMLPLKDFDNLFIPLILAAIAQNFAFI